MTLDRDLRIVIVMMALSVCAWSSLAETSAAEMPPAETSPVDRFQSLFGPIADLQEFVRSRGDEIWPGLAEAPFGILLIGGEGEVLLCDARVPEGFTRSGTEPLTACETSFGPSSWRSPSLLAAMPAFGPPSVVAVGTPAATSKSTSAWQLTLAHEHFHQWQAELPDYYQRVEALDLSGGDTTGMWMINYPFPYDAPEFVAALGRSSEALETALRAPDGEELERAVAEFLVARSALEATVSESDWRYFEFQLWQEGVARWTEVALGELHPDGDIRRVAGKLRQRAMGRVQTPRIAQDGRLAVYPYGFAEAELLERITTDWRALYPSVLGLGPLFARVSDRRPPPKRQSREGEISASD